MKALIFVWFGVVLAGGLGWVMNVVKLISHIHDPLNTLEVCRIVGVFAAPLGAVLGYL